MSSWSDSASRQHLATENREHSHRRAFGTSRTPSVSRRTSGLVARQLDSGKRHDFPLDLLHSPALAVDPARDDLSRANMDSGSVAEPPSVELGATPSDVVGARGDLDGEAARAADLDDVGAFRPVECDSPPNWCWAVTNSANHLEYAVYAPRCRR